MTQILAGKSLKARGYAGLAWSFLKFQVERFDIAGMNSGRLRILKAGYSPFPVLLYSQNQFGDAEENKESAYVHHRGQHRAGHHCRVQSE